MRERKDGVNNERGVASAGHNIVGGHSSEVHTSESHNVTNSHNRSTLDARRFENHSKQNSENMTIGSHNITTIHEERNTSFPAAAGWLIGFVVLVLTGLIVWLVMHVASKGPSPGLNGHTKVSTAVSPPAEANPEPQPARITPQPTVRDTPVVPPPSQSSVREPAAEQTSTPASSVQAEPMTALGTAATPSHQVVQAPSVPKPLELEALPAKDTHDRRGKGEFLAAALDGHTDGSSNQPSHQHGRLFIRRALLGGK